MPYKDLNLRIDMCKICSFYLFDSPRDFSAELDALNRINDYGAVLCNKWSNDIRCSCETTVGMGAPPALFL